jgi:hypothetical protein
MIEIPITEGMKLRADSKAQQMPEDWPNGIIPDGGNYPGCVGEEAFLFAYPKAVSKNTFKFDSVYQTYTFEVKSKQRNVPPLPEYACNIPWSSTHQDPDFYVWISLLLKRDKAFICGYISRDHFYKVADFREKGNIDPTNKQTELKGSYQCEIKDLWNPEELRGLQAPRPWKNPGG